MALSPKSALPQKDFPDLFLVSVGFRWSDTYKERHRRLYNSTLFYTGWMLNGKAGKMYGERYQEYWELGTSLALLFYFHYDVVSDWDDDFFLLLINHDKDCQLAGFLPFHTSLYFLAHRRRWITQLNSLSPSKLCNLSWWQLIFFRSRKPILKLEENKVSYRPQISLIW